MARSDGLGPQQGSTWALWGFGLQALVRFWWEGLPQV